MVPFFMVAAGAVILAFVLPSVYRSTAVILIEQREIPAEYVTSSLTTYAEQRMQSINQRVLTSARLLELIKQFDLYQELRKRETTDEIIARMRRDISLEPVNVDVTDRKSGRTATATIAFTLSYEGKNARKVQQVANTITSLFLKEDLKVRKDQASTTFLFLRNEKEKIRRQVAECEKKIAEFKKQHVQSLPELFPVNLQILDTLKRNIDRTRETLRTLREKEGELEDKLANTAVDLNSAMMRKNLMDEDEKRLENLKMELIRLKTRFSELYPDVRKIRQEIKELSKKIELKKNRKKADHTDITGDSVKNPAYVTLSSRLAGLRSDIKSVKNNLAALEKEEAECKAKLAATPGVEEKYNALVARRNVLNAKLHELQGKMMEARIAQELEAKQKGEHFTLIDSARLPEKPYKPDRTIIILIGIVLALGAGIGSAAVAEFSDTSFTDAISLAKATGFPVLTEVPEIITSRDMKAAKKRRIIIWTAIIAAVIAGAWLFNTCVMDFDVLTAKIMRRFS